jgi:glucose-1-phosphate adenylyltransferase
MIGEGATIEDYAIIKKNNNEINVVSEYEVVKSQVALEGGLK